MKQNNNENEKHAHGEACSCEHDHAHGEACSCEHDHAHSEACSCGHDDCDDNNEVIYAVLDASRGATICGVLGAVLDLGLCDLTTVLAAAKSLGFAVPEIELSQAHGCSGVSVKFSEGKRKGLEFVEDKIAALHEFSCSAAHMAEAVYQQIYAACAQEQGVTDGADLGTFGREDVIAELLMTTVALSDAQKQLETGLIVTPIELGGGILFDHGVEVNAPCTLATLLLSDFHVTVRDDRHGVDLPTAALISAVAEGAVKEVDGMMRACGVGFSGDSVTRIYLLGDSDAG